MDPATTHPRLAWLAALRDPARALEWPLAEWDHTIRLARRLRLLGRLAEALDAAGLLERVPTAARQHLVSDLRLSRWRTTVATWALGRVAAALDTSPAGPAPYPRVLLKGAAYLAQGLAVAAGRLPSDIDILVPHEHLADAQARLADAGWHEAELDEHDRHYYRAWSHEAPPMRHLMHAIELDLHHNILPPVARTTVDAAKLLARVQPSPWPGWQVFHPLDQVLHSASHLFLDSEPRDRLRDLIDLDGLLRHFGDADPGFWAALPARATELGLAEELALAVHFTTTWLGTPVPADARERIARQGPGAARRAWLTPLMGAVLWPAPVDGLPPLRQELAALGVLARYHANRLPLSLLLPHLWRKWRLRRAEEAAPEKVDEAAATAAQQMPPNAP